MKNQDFQDLEFSRKGLIVVFEYIGEGFSGDYDENDPDDDPLLRFSCFRIEGGERVEIPDSSYCTLLPTNTRKEHLEQASKSILDALELPSPKRELERLSWFGPNDFY